MKSQLQTSFTILATYVPIGQSKKPSATLLYVLIKASAPENTARKIGYVVIAVSFHKVYLILAIAFESGYE